MMINVWLKCPVFWCNVELQRVKIDCHGQRKGLQEKCVKAGNNDHTLIERGVYDRATLPPGFGYGCTLVDVEGIKVTVRV